MRERHVGDGLPQDVTERLPAVLEADEMKTIFGHHTLNILDMPVVQIFFLSALGEADSDKLDLPGVNGADKPYSSIFLMSSASLLSTTNSAGR